MIFFNIIIIGFGDFVPGIKNFKNKEKSNTDGIRIMLGVSYLIFGIVVIAMCFDLAYEDVFVQWTKLKFILKSSSSNDNDDESISDDSVTRNQMLDYIRLVKEDNGEHRKS